MEYVSLTGLEAHMGEAAYAKWLAGQTNPEGELAGCEGRLLALILPARPANDEQAAAFSRAVYAQIEHEAMQEALPEGLKSFSLGSFSATMDAGRRPAACPGARAELLNAGLLYRGVKC